MAIRIYNDRIKFVADSDNDTDIDLLIESDGLRFTGTLTTAYNVAYTAPPQIPIPAMNGQTDAFAAGGYVPASFSRISQIDKYPFTISSGTATDVGDLSSQRNYAAGFGGDTDGFVAGGQEPPGAAISSIDKFPFAISSGTATDAGDLFGTVGYVSPSQNTTDGFVNGGTTPTNSNTIYKFPFAISSGTGTDVGDLTVARNQTSGHSSETEGFTAGGITPSLSNVIDKYPFTISSGTATDVGDLDTGNRIMSSHSSPTDGYYTGGLSPPNTPNYLTRIVKFPFAISSGTATKVGDLNTGIQSNSGNQTASDGFTWGGFKAPGTPNPTRANAEIEKWPFSISSGTATDVGNLATERKDGPSGVQD